MMMKNFAAPVMALSVLAGCAVGPDFKTPEPPAVSGYTKDPLPVETVSAAGVHGAAQRFVADMDIAIGIGRPVVQDEPQPHSA